MFRRRGRIRCRDGAALLIPAHPAAVRFGWVIAPELEAVMQIEAMIRKSAVELVGTFALSFSNYWNNHLIYWMGCLMDALIAGLLYNYLFLPKPDAAAGR
jgi:hypothetical protein